MNHVCFRILVLLFFCCSTFSQSSTSTHFVPIPLSDDYPSRVSVGLNMEPTPSSFELEVNYLLQIGRSFDVGLGLHGGALGKGGYGILGVDAMFHFLRPINEAVFMGIQAQVGYVYTGIGDVSLAPNVPNAFPITTGLIIGGVVRDLTRFYFFPAVEFGQTSNADDKLWKSGIGLRFTLGTAVSIGDTTYLVLETRPRIANLVDKDLSAFSTFSIDAMLGLLFDF
ncbi:MAG: hypothetical protein WCK49_02385 [Myxococcaceae bacterium]